MKNQVSRFVDDFMAGVIARNPAEPEFYQAVHEVVESLAPFIVENPALMKNKILERMAEPERVIMFRVPWLDDRGERSEEHTSELQSRPHLVCRLLLEKKK